MINEKKLLEISANEDLNYFISNDTVLTKAIVDTVENLSPLAFRICHSFSLIKSPGNLVLSCVETASILLEEIVHPELHVVEAMQTMERLTGEELLQSPIWFYIARTKVSKHKKFQNILIRHFPKNPAFFSEVMEKTGEALFIPHMHSHLQLLSPFLKYLPLEEGSHEWFLPHDQWLRIGAAYARLVKKEGSYPEDLPGVLDFLEKRFFHLLQDDVEAWLESISEEERTQFEKFSELYNSYFEFMD